MSPFLLMTDTTPGPTIGWQDFGGRRAYFDGEAWTDENGNVMAAKTGASSNTPPPAAPVSSAPVLNAAPGWPSVLGVLALVAGVIVFLVPPASSDTGLYSVVNFPTMFLQYGIALALVLAGVLFVCTGVIVQTLYRRR